MAVTTPARSVTASATATVHLKLELEVSLNDFNTTEQLKLQESLALAAGLTRADALMVTLEVHVIGASALLRRAAGGRIQVDAYIACRDAMAAAAVVAALTPASISNQLQAAGLPPASILLAPVVQVQVSKLHIDSNHWHVKAIGVLGIFCFCIHTGVGLMG
jgi:hypothetical protein